MDRNVFNSVMLVFSFSSVATREGGVDRNSLPSAARFRAGESPPARVAWIETLNTYLVKFILPVATREGGVDRNITPTLEAALPTCVATREGGVDRNVTSEYNFALHLSSPPARVAGIETKPA